MSPRSEFTEMKDGVALAKRSGCQHEPTPSSSDVRRHHDRGEVGRAAMLSEPDVMMRVSASLRACSILGAGVDRRWLVSPMGRRAEMNHFAGSQWNHRIPFR